MIEILIAVTILVGLLIFWTLVRISENIYSIAQNIYVLITLLKENAAHVQKRNANEGQEIQQHG